MDDNPHSLSREEVTKWQDEGVIEWRGRVSNIQDWLKQADVFVLPSFYREGVPRSTQEAMALGRAIITTDHVGCRETVDDGVNGILVPPRDVDALVRAMRRLIETPRLAQQMGTASRRLAEERFDAGVSACLLARRAVARSSAMSHRPDCKLKQTCRSTRISRFWSRC